MGLGVDGQRPAQELRQLGWDLVEPQEVVPDHSAYRSFLTNSRGEWSVAKHGYMEGRTGWFSCRTACYLAAGRPAVVQETGWSRHLPSDRGVLPFTTLDEAAEGLGKVTRNYSEHSKAAREIALEFFDAKKVCQELLRQV